MISSASEGLNKYFWDIIERKEGISFGVSTFTSSPKKFKVVFIICFILKRF